MILSIETFWKVIGLWISISYEGYFAHVCQNQAVTCAKPCANTDKYNYLWALLAHFEYHFGRFSCANLIADCWHTIVNNKPNRRRSCSSDIFGVFCWVKRGIKRHQDIDNYLFVCFGIYIVHRPNQTAFQTVFNLFLFTQKESLQPAYVTISMCILASHWGFVSEQRSSFCRNPQDARCYTLFHWWAVERFVPTTFLCLCRNGSDHLLVRLVPFFFLPESCTCLLSDISEGECARIAASSAPVWWHLLSLRKVLSPGHPGKVRFALHLALPMSCRVTYSMLRKRCFTIKP